MSMYSNNKYVPYGGGYEDDLYPPFERERRGGYIKRYGTKGYASGFGQNRHNGAKYERGYEQKYGGSGYGGGGYSGFGGGGYRDREREREREREYSRPIRYIDREAEEATNRGEVILDDRRRLQINKFNGRCYVHVREYYLAEDGRKLPSKKGMSLSIANWRKILENVDKVNKIIEQIEKELIAEGHDVNETTGSNNSSCPNDERAPHMLAARNVLKQLNHEDALSYPNNEPFFDLKKSLKADDHNIPTNTETTDTSNSNGQKPEQLEMRNLGNSDNSLLSHDSRSIEHPNIQDVKSSYDRVKLNQLQQQPPSQN